jgi:tetratricopeptide (TPR) repeat protein
MRARLVQFCGLLLAGLLLAGCRSTPLTSATARHASLPADEAQRAAAHAHYAQGVIEESNGRTAEALEQYHAAAMLDPGNEDLVTEVARRWILQKKSDRALEVLKLGVAQPSSSAMLDVLMGTAYAQAGHTNLATEANLRAVRKAPRLLAGYQNLFAGRMQAGQPDEAMRVLDGAARQRDTDPDFLIGLAELYLNLATATPATNTNAQPKALQLLQRAESLTITNVPSRVRLADGFYVLGEVEKAAALYQQLLADYPQAPMLQENLRAKLTDIYLRGKDRKRAIEQLEAIVRESPMNLQAHYYLGLLESEGGNAARAMDHYRTVVVLNPKFEQAYYDLAMAQLGADKTNDVFATLETAQKKFNQNFISEFLLGVANVRVGRFDEAVRRFTSAEIIARATDPKRLTAVFYFQFGAALERKGDYSESVKYLQKALEMQPDFPEAANHLGYMWAERGENLERARELIERAVKAEPKNEAYLDSLAWVLFKLGRAAEALTIMKQAVEIAEAEQQPDATLYEHLGDIHFALGDTDQARAAWERTLKLEPNEEVRKKLDRLKGP